MNLMQLPDEQKNQDIEVADEDLEQKLWINNNYFLHPVGVSKEPISNICRFGHDASWFIAFYLIIRGI